ncbi:MAG: PAC2 family protein [Actinobacteria bacterium]|nr:PAC2 family protein [Actinomycetota bacterium]
MSETVNIFNGRVLVVALDGWTDAGSGATGAANYIREKLGAERLLNFDDPEYFDYLRQRPVIVLDEHGDRDFLWPSIELWGPSKDKVRENNLSLYFLIGQEPALQWPYLRDEIREIVEDREITSVIMLGSLAAEAPHNRPIKIYKNSQSAAVRNAYGLERSNYDGRSGFMSVLGHAFEKAGLPTISIWAQVPHYVASMPSPKAALALVNDLEIFLKFSVDHKDLLTAAFEWERSVDDFVEGDEDLANYIQSLEKARDESEAEEMNTDALALEFEQFLRQNENKESGDKES